MAPRSAAPARPKLDREVVIDTALGVADAEGLDAVTIRRLAQELSVTPMALYWHFDGKDALLAAAADRLWADTVAELERLLADLSASGEDEGGWGQLRVTLDALLVILRRHPALAHLVPSRVVECDAGLDVTERTLAFLADRGFPPSRAAEVARFVLCGVVMLVDSQPGAEIAAPTERAEMQRLKKIALASLPPGRYPHVMAAADHLTDCDSPDDYFDRAVDLIVAGVCSQVPGAAAVSRSARHRSG